VGEVYKTNVDTTLHTGNKAVTSNGLIRMQFPHSPPLSSTPVTSSNSAKIVSVDDLGQLRRQNPHRLYQDVVWAIAFVVHLIVVAVVIAVVCSLRKEFRRRGPFTSWVSRV